MSPSLEVQAEELIASVVHEKQKALTCGAPSRARLPCALSQYLFRRSNSCRSRWCRRRGARTWCVVLECQHAQLWLIIWRSGSPASIATRRVSILARFSGFSTAKKIKSGRRNEHIVTSGINLSSRRAIRIVPSHSGMGLGRKEGRSLRSKKRRISWLYALKRAMYFLPRVTGRFFNATAFFASRS